MATGYSPELTKQLLSSFISGGITETQFRQSLAEMGVPQHGIDTMIQDASQMREAAISAPTLSAGESPVIAVASTLLWVAIAVAVYFFFFR